jgi:hypothetical protein
MEEKHTQKMNSIVLEIYCFHFQGIMYYTILTDTGQVSKTRTCTLHAEYCWGRCLSFLFSVIYYFPSSIYCSLLFLSDGFS